jgi:sigma-70-like protein
MGEPFLRLAMINERLGSVMDCIPVWADGQTGPEVSDAQLVEQFAAERNEGAFAHLMKRHGNMVFGTCRRVAGNFQDAEDAFQVTFLLLARQASTIRRRQR